MKRLLFILLSIICLTACTEKQTSLKKINQVDFSKVQITDNFWSPRLERHTSVTLPVCIDQIENQTGRIRNFENGLQPHQSS